MPENEMPALQQEKSALPFDPLENTELVSLNRVLEHGLLPYGPALKAGSLVARSEPLPSVRGSHTGLTYLFQQLFSLLLRPGADKSPQYLHVDCVEKKSEVLDLTLENGFQYFEIQFKTNRKLSRKAAEAEYEILNTCQEFLKASHGTLQIFCVEGEGCLFSILLQGKLN